MSKILFIQFSNSGGYPPVQNAVRLCLREGHEVSVLCIESEGSASLKFPDDMEKITRRLPRASGRVGLLFLYARFSLRVLWRIFLEPKQWLYVSDPMAAPAAYYAKKIFGCRVIYHEHDAPPPPNNRSQRFVDFARTRIAKIADAVVMPNAERLRLYLEGANASDRANVFTVWNCPLAEEIVAPALSPTADQRNGIKLYFHGSISPSLLPLSLLKAMAKTSSGVSLGIAGYPTDGGLHLQNIRDEAERLGIADRVRYLGAFSRDALLPLCAQHDVGICFYDANPGLFNHRHMAGASNKPFDYLSQGLALLISDTKEQRDFFDGLESAIFCDTQSVGSIAAALDELDANDMRRGIARTSGPRLIKEKWNYAIQFKPLLALLKND